MTNGRPDVVLIGCGPTALSALESLLCRCNVRTIFRFGDHTDPVIKTAREHGVQVIGEVYSERISEVIREMQPDCTVISSFDRILQPSILALCPFVNVHYSPLPRYRGRANVNWALINDEPSAAISIHVVEPNLDGGNILFQRAVPIDDRLTVTDLYRTLNQLQQDHLGDTVCKFIGGYPGVPQIQADATYGCTRTPEDGEIDWSAPTRTIYNLIRALQDPYPGAYTFYNCRQLAVLSAAIVDDGPKYVGRIPGRVIAVRKNTGTVDVLTGDGILRIHSVRGADESCRPAAEVIRSTKDLLGLSARQLLHRMEQLERRVQALTSLLGSMHITTVQAISREGQHS
jgi:methionyl-tRNA formyltransferase